MEAKLPIGTIASIAGIASAGVGIAGALGASGTQASADNTAANTQLSMYNQTRQDLSPYNQGGQSAFSNLQSFLGPNGGLGTLLGFNPSGAAGQLSALQNTPGYQFALSQGTQALDRSAAAKGTLLSGGQLKDLTAYGQGMGSQLFNNTVNQYQNYATDLSGISSLGENAAALTGNAGATAAAGAASSQAAAGQASASGIAGATNQIAGPQGVIQNALQAYQLQNGSSFAPYTGGNVNVTPSPLGATGGVDSSTMFFG